MSGHHHARMDGVSAPSNDEFMFDAIPPHSLHHFDLYETQAWLYLVGRCVDKVHSRVLKVRKSVQEGLSLEPVAGLFTSSQVENMLQMIQSGNEDLKKRGSFKAILGFLRLTCSYYIIVVTRARCVARIGPHSVFAVEATEMVAVAEPDLEKTKAYKAIKQQEQRYLHLFELTDLSKHFYYSPSYDITQSIQAHALARRRCTLDGSGGVGATTEAEEGLDEERQGDGGSGGEKWQQRVNKMFLWNDYLREVVEKNTLIEDWVVRAMHGFISERVLSIHGRHVRLALVARRSKEYAGTRFLKRGVSYDGFVANDVEVEQILCPDCGLRPSQTCPITSFAQMRGSVPTFWRQDASVLDPKPEIDLHSFDLSHAATVKHFREIIHRYAEPVFVMNLVKIRERKPRETKLASQFLESMNALWEHVERNWDKGTDTTKITGEGKRLEVGRTNKNHDEPARMGGSATGRPTADESRPGSGTARGICGGGDHIGKVKSSGEQQSSSTPSIEYVHWDFSLVAKDREKNVVSELNSMLHPIVERVGFFHSTSDLLSDSDAIRWQRGVLRVNCIDCLDRTNVAQLCMAKLVLGHQFHALGISPDGSVRGNSAVVDHLIQMYEQLGDALSLQYGGSEAVKSGKLDKLKKHLEVGAVTGKTNKMVTKLVTNAQRFYSNVMTDTEKQASMNLFLGIFRPPLRILDELQRTGEIGPRSRSGSEVSLGGFSAGIIVSDPSSSSSWGSRFPRNPFRDVWNATLGNSASNNPQLWEFDTDFYMHNNDKARADTLWCSHAKVQGVVSDMVEELRWRGVIENGGGALDMGVAGRGTDGDSEKGGQGGACAVERGPMDHKLLRPINDRRRERQSIHNAVAYARYGLTFFDELLSQSPGGGAVVQNALLPIRSSIGFKATGGSSGSAGGTVVNRGDDEVSSVTGDGDGDEGVEDHRKFKRWFVFTKGRIGELPVTSSTTTHLNRSTATSRGTSSGGTSAHDGGSKAVRIGGRASGIVGNDGGTMRTRQRGNTSVASRASWMGAPVPSADHELYRRFSSTTRPDDGAPPEYYLSPLTPVPGAKTNGEYLDVASLCTLDSNTLREDLVGSIGGGRDKLGGESSCNGEVGSEDSEGVIGGQRGKVPAVQNLRRGGLGSVRAIGFGLFRRATMVEPGSGGGSGEVDVAGSHGGIGDIGDKSKASATATEDLAGNRRGKQGKVPRPGPAAAAQALDDLSSIQPYPCYPQNILKDYSPSSLLCAGLADTLCDPTRPIASDDMAIFEQQCALGGGTLMD